MPSVPGKNGYQTLYRFTGGADGANPQYPVVMYDHDLYSTTDYGGADDNGTIFKLRRGTETVLYSFTGGKDGTNPTGITIDQNTGAIVGTAFVGGSGSCSGSFGAGCGTVFSFADGTLTTLHEFEGGANDGAIPNAALLKIGDNYYGTTAAGGTGSCTLASVAGCGTVFSIGADGKETILHSFQGGSSDGAVPFGPLVADSSGNLYGTTVNGGNGTCTFYGVSGCGTVFKLEADGSGYSVLYLFCSQNNCADGAEPYTEALLLDPKGNLYGTTSEGGATDFGTVFKLSPKGNEKVVYSFCSKKNCVDGSDPLAGVIADEEGNLYGTTEAGGRDAAGTVFELVPNGAEKVLHSFDSSDGRHPNSALIVDKSGNLYGTALDGGLGYGTVFKLKE